MKPIYFVLVAIAVYLFYKYSSATVTKPDASATSNNVVSDPVYDSFGNTVPVGSKILGYNPPPGYSGPTNGPFVWAGSGEPTHGYQTQGVPIYGY